jgi:hypothetical protein
MVRSNRCQFLVAGHAVTDIGQVEDAFFAEEWQCAFEEDR